MKSRPNQCASCPFSEGGLKLGNAKMLEIQVYLLEGTNHFCHSDRTNQTVCRGGRLFQLQCWASTGLIAAPTDEALRVAMRANGVEPREHI